jgi:hypothetical protein
MKLLIKSITKHSFENADIFSGAFESKGVLIKAVVTDCPNKAHFDIGLDQFTVSDGQEIEIFLRDKDQDTLGCLWRVQQQVATDVPLVAKQVTSKFIAEDAYGRDVACDTIEEALDAHKRFGNPRQIDTVLFVQGA